MTKEPPKMKRGPGKLVSLFNALRDFCISERVLPGQGLVVNETVKGKQLSLIPSVLALARQYEENNSGSPDNPANPGGGGNVFDGGGSGTGLPDTGTDEEGNPTDPDGNPLAWQEVKVCVSDGAGGWTPGSLKVYASLS